MLTKFLNLALLLLSIVHAQNVASHSTEAIKITNATTSTSYVHRSKRTIMSSTVCYEPLGCFGRMDFFDLKKRPINFYPQSPERVNATYNLYTMKNRYKEKALKYNVTKEEILATNFNSSKPTKFIIHGFTESFDAMNWMGDIKDFIFTLAGDKYNVIGVDWHSGTDTYIYMQAVANTRIVGAMTAHFIQKLVEYTGTNVQDIHIIGHSLGAHISGYVGEKFKNPKIGRITALDAAGPDFYADNPRERLDKTDAAYVDAIHTDYGSNVLQGYGIWDTVGMDDFYPNGGYQQPGCSLATEFSNIIERGIAWGTVATMACNHWRSWVLFIVNPNNMNEKCQYVGYECESWDKFSLGHCGDCGANQEKCGVFSVFGPHDPQYGHLFQRHMNLVKNIDTKERRLYFKTGRHEPFCLHHFQIVIYLGDDMPEEVRGSVKLSLQGELRTVTSFNVGKLINTYEAGMKVTALGTWVQHLGRIDKVILDWTIAGLRLKHLKKVLPKLFVDKIEVNYMSNFDPHIRKRFSSVLCPKSGRIIENGSTKEFVECEK